MAISVWPRSARHRQHRRSLAKTKEKQRATERQSIAGVTSHSRTALYRLAPAISLLSPSELRSHSCIGPTFYPYQEGKVNDHGFMLCM